MSPSGSVAIELLLCLMAFMNCSVVKRTGCGLLGGRAKTDVLRDALQGLRCGGYCRELFEEGGGYFVVIGDLSFVEGHWLVGGNAWFLPERFGDERETTSGVLCTLTELYPSPQILSVVFG